MQKYGSNDDPLMESWNSMQQNLKCCGVESYKDWQATSWTNPANLVPTSCCREVSDICSFGAVLLPEAAAQIVIYTEGCVTKALNDIGIKWLLIAAAVVAAVELLGIIFACCLAGRFRRKNYNV